MLLQSKPGDYVHVRRQEHCRAERVRPRPTACWPESCGVFSASTPYAITKPPPPWMIAPLLACWAHCLVRYSPHAETCISPKQNGNSTTQTTRFHSFTAHWRCSRAQARLSVLCRGVINGTRVGRQAMESH